MSLHAPEPLRNLVICLGDQLSPDSPALDGFDRSRDAVWMAEASGEAAHVWSHKARIALFLSAMRHFRDALRARDIIVRYSELTDPANTGTLSGELRRAIKALRPQRVVMTEPGEWRVREDLLAVVREAGVDLQMRPDRHFVCTLDDFNRHAEGRKQLRMEYFYREVRRRMGALMEGDQPRGGQWNFDAENRSAFGDAGPENVPEPLGFPPDGTTREVISLVTKRFADHPGSLRHFDWPVTPDQASAALHDFVANRLSSFGPYQDAMWTGQPYLYHSRLSAAMNLKLLDPREEVAAAENALDAGAANLPSVEGFVRQIIGWREYVRGIYWRFMPDYLDRNALTAEAPLPRFYWTGDTEMACLRETIGQTLEHGYAHHIQRLMVTGLFALLMGVDPRRVHEWYLAIYVDAVEWVELPNVYGMSQYADGGLMASKPYVASGKYIQRMSDYCKTCRFRPGERTGEDACPFTTLYWDFLLRNGPALNDNPRMALQLRNVDRLPQDESRAIRTHADGLRRGML